MKYVSYFIMGLLFVSCKNGYKKDPILDDIAKIIYQHPDRVLNRLRSYRIDEKDEYNYCRYWLYKVQSKDMTDTSISSDFLILDAYSYFQKKGLKSYAGLSSYYCGRVFQENNLIEEALGYFWISETYARKNNIKELLALCLYSSAKIMFDQLLFHETKTMMTEAISLFEETNNYEYLVKCYILLGRSYNMTQQYDTAQLYFNKGLELAVKHRDRRVQAQASLGIGITYNEQGDHKKAIRYYNSAAQKDSIVFESGHVLFNMSKSYLYINQLDSARYYAKRSLQFAKMDSLQNLFTLSKVYNILSLIEINSKNYKAAIEYAQMNSNSLLKLLEINKNTAIVVAERKYKYDQIRDEKEKLAQKQRESVIIIMAILLISGIILIIYYKKLLIKTKQLNKASEDIFNLNNEIITLTESLAELSLKKDFMRDNLNQNYKILQRAAYMESLVQNSDNKQGKVLIKLFNEIAYGSETPVWEILYPVLDTVHYGTLQKIKDTYPILDDSEFKICCLIYSQFSSSETAVITKLSTSTVHVKTTSIRKKLEIEKYGNITDFINNKFNITDNKEN